MAQLSPVQTDNAAQKVVTVARNRSMPQLIGRFAQAGAQLLGQSAQART